MQPSIEITGIEEIQAALSRLQRRVAHLQPMMAEIGNTIQNRIEQSFEESRSPFGKGWKPSKKASGKTLIDSGTLSGSFVSTPTESEVSVGTNLIYAAIHHYGGRAGRGYRVTLPARPFIPADEGQGLESGVQEEIVEMLGAWILQA